MEFLDLEYLLVAADVGRFALAAKILGVETSTVSRRIANLEDELHLALFERDHAGVRLTQGGNWVAHYARRVLFEFEGVKRIGRQFATGHTGEIRLGVRMPPTTGMAKTLLAGWRETTPDVALAIVEANERQLLLGLIEHHLDAVLVTGHSQWPYTSSLTLFRERLVLAVPDGHFLARKASLDWRALVGEIVLVQQWDDEHTQRDLYGAMLGEGARFQGHAVSQLAIVGLVGAGLGVALVPQSFAETDYPGVSFRPVVEANAWIDFEIAWLPEAEDATLGRFIAFLRDHSRAIV